MSDSLEKLEQLTAKLSSDPYAALDSMFATSRDLLCVVTTNGYFAKVSASFSTELGWSNEELLAIPFLDLLHTEDLQPTLECWANTQAGNPTDNFKNRYRCKDGSFKTLVWTLPGLVNGLAFSIARIDRYAT